MIQQLNEICEKILYKVADEYLPLTLILMVVGIIATIIGFLLNE